MIMTAALPTALPATAPLSAAEPGGAGPASFVSMLQILMAAGPAADQATIQATTQSQPGTPDPNQSPDPRPGLPRAAVPDPPERPATSGGLNQAETAAPARPDKATERHTRATQARPRPGSTRQPTAKRKPEASAAIVRQDDSARPPDTLQTLAAAPGAAETKAPADRPPPRAGQPVSPPASAVSDSNRPDPAPNAPADRRSAHSGQPDLPPVPGPPASATDAVETHVRVERPKPRPGQVATTTAPPLAPPPPANDPPTDPPIAGTSAATPPVAQRLAALPIPRPPPAQTPPRAAAGPTRADTPDHKPARAADDGANQPAEAPARAIPSQAVDPPPATQSSVLPASAAPKTAATARAYVAAAPTSSPAYQLTPVLLSVMEKPNGTERITVRLHPADLGTVQVRIERASDRSAHITISAEKPETLQILKADQGDLHRTLDLAGVPAEGRTITFHAPPAQTPASAAVDLSADDNGGGGAAAREHTGRGPSRGQPGTPATRDDDAAPDHWLPVGLDITA
jgi:flagellar hook-length control protein FliK